MFWDGTRWLLLAAHVAALFLHLDLLAELILAAHIALEVVQAIEARR